MNSTMPMETEEITQEAKRTLRQAGSYVRENPVPTIIGALAVGFAVGLLVRSMEEESRAEVLRGKLDDAEDYLRSVIGPLAKRSKRAYAKSAEAVRDAVERARDIEVEDYTDPMIGWWQRLWKKI